MKKTYLSAISLLLALLMLAGVLSACKNKGGDETTSPETSAVTETQGVGETESKSQAESTEDNTEDNTEGGTSTSSGTETDPPAGSESESGGETAPGDTQTTEKDDQTTETEKPEIVVVENEYDAIIDNAYALAGGVQGYFTSDKRTHLVLENQQVNLTYARSLTYDQQIASLTNKNGIPYIENTMDVFVTMKNGNTFYASQSCVDAKTNFFRLGYYYYEARVEGQSFVYAVYPEAELPVKLVPNSSSSNHIVDIATNDGVLSFKIRKNGTDPYVVIDGINHSAEEYNYVQFTMKSSEDKDTSGQIFYKANGKTGYSEAQSVRFAIKGDGEYHTYTVKLEGENYKGDVTAFRIDLNPTPNAEYEIKDLKFIKGNDGGTPESLSIVRSFLMYSNKLHSFAQFASENVATTDIERLGFETKIPKTAVSKVITMDKDGLHDSFEGVDWASAEYVGFDITAAGIFGFILPADGQGGSLEVRDDGENYVIIQWNTPENNTINPSVEKTDNANDYYIGQRIYTDDTHSFDDFVYEAYNERNPLKGIAVYKLGSTGGDTVEYDALRGIYSISIDYDTFVPAYYQWPNKHYNVNFAIKGDGRERNIYVMTKADGLCLECAALLDKNDLMLPIPIQVGKNFSEANGERNLYNMDDVPYSEAIIPVTLQKNEKYEFNLLNLYQNWGKVPLKQISWIQFYAPVYHLSTGVIETNCIVPYGGMRNTGTTLSTLPDHRAMSAPFWTDQPQHSSGGIHHWLLYSDAKGNYSSSENISNTIDSFGPTYADINMEYISHDGKISVTYTHTEMPQTDENRAYYEMKYTVLEDISFKDFAHSFSFYSVSDNDPTGLYQNVGYLDANNESQVVAANLTPNTHVDYLLGDECPYFCFFNMDNYTSTSQQGYVNLSFLIYDAEFIIGGEKAEPQFLLVNYYNYLTLSLNLDEVTFKAGDTFTINAIVMPWGSQESVYDSNEFAPDWNVRAVRENSLLNRVHAVPEENAEEIESVFVPKVRSTNGKQATFTLKGGYKNKSAELGNHNIAVRIYGFERITAPVIEEFVDGEWVVYEVNSIRTPDAYGNAHSYDGYCIYKDPDGTYSYSFVVDMTEGVDRKFRVSADKAFDGWPYVEVEDVGGNDPIEKYYTPGEILTLSASAASSCESITISDDFTSVRFTGLKERALEATFNLFSENEAETGNYIVFKYRIPTYNEKDIEYLEFWAGTEFDTPSQARKSFRIKSGALYEDGQWHLAIIDLTDWNQDVFKMSDDGKYYSKYFRIDVFNSAIGANTSIDFAIIGMGADLGTTLQQFPEMKTAAIYTTDTQKTLISVATGEAVDGEIGVPGDALGGDSGESGGDNGEQGGTTEPAEKLGITYEIPASAVYEKAQKGALKGKIELLENGSYTRFYSSTQYREVYFTAFNKGTVSSGQYLIIKYRTTDKNARFEIWASTVNDGAKEGDNKTLLQTNDVIVADGEWHTLVLDLSGWRTVSDYKGTYDLKYIRLDLFDYDKPAADETAWIDIAYLALSDDYDTAIDYDEDADIIEVYNGSSLTTVNKAASRVGVTYEINATQIFNKAQGGPRMDKLELLENGSYTRFYSSTQYREVYFTAYTKGAIPSGQYLIVKYRTNDNGARFEFWTSTENKGATAGDNKILTSAMGVVKGDEQWHVLIVDLGAWKTVSATDGVYDLNYLRFDLFDYDKAAADENSWIDIEFIAFSNSYDEAVAYDESAESIIYFDGSVASTVEKTAE